MPKRIIVTVLTLAAVQGYALAGDDSAPRRGLASQHIVSQAEARASAVTLSAERGARLEIIARFLDSEAARAQLANWGLDPHKVKTAVSRLNDRELADLAARAHGVMAGLQGGKRPITYYLLALWLPIILILVLII